MKNERATFEEAAEALWPFTQERITPFVLEIGRKPLDFSPGTLAAADKLAERLADNPALDVSDEPKAVLRLIYARLTFAISLSALRPDDPIPGIPGGLPADELLAALLRKEIRGMTLPGQGFH